MHLKSFLVIAIAASLGLPALTAGSAAAHPGHPGGHGVYGHKKRGHRVYRKKRRYRVRSRHWRPRRGVRVYRHRGHGYVYVPPPPPVYVPRYYRDGGEVVIIEPEPQPGPDGYGYEAPEERYEQAPAGEPETREDAAPLGPEDLEPNYYDSPDKERFEAEPAPEGHTWERETPPADDPQVFENNGDFDDLLDEEFAPHPGAQPQPPQQPQQPPQQPDVRPEQPPHAQPSAPDDGLSDALRVRIEAEIVRLINIERQRAGLYDLSAHANLDAAALGHSAEMFLLDYFDHTSPLAKNRQFTDRLKNAGVRDFGRAGENIAMRSWSRGESAEKVAAELVRMWMDSPGHKKNILTPGYRFTGVGVFGDERGVYATQVFSSKVGLARGASAQVPPEEGRVFSL